MPVIEGKQHQCRLFVQGNCRFGDRCKFTHDVGPQHELAVETSGPRRHRGRVPTIPGPRVSDNPDSPRKPGRGAYTPGGVPRTAEDAHIPKIRKKRGELACKAWKGGSCKGTKCWFTHDPEAQSNWSRQQAEARDAEVVGCEGTRLRGEEKERVRETARARDGARERAQRAILEAQRKAEEWRIQEEVEKRIRYAEDVRRREEASLQREERERTRLAEEERVQEATRLREEAREREWQARLAELEAQRQAREAAHQARMAEVARDEAANTIQQLVLGSLVTFGAGIEVRHLITGFESCTVQVKGLPLDAREEDVASIFLNWGMEAGQFTVLENKIISGGKRSAKVVTDTAHGKAMLIALEDTDLRSETLAFEVGTFNSPGGMGASSPRDSDVLNISWPAPSARFVAAYSDMETAKQWMSTLDGKVHMGRRLKVQMNTLPPGRTISSYNQDMSIDEGAIIALAGPVVTVRRLRQIGPGHNNDHVVTSLRSQIERMSHRLISFEETNHKRKLDGITVVKARFDSWDEANRIHQLLTDGTFPRSMGLRESAFWLHLPTPMQYVLTIPTAQHSAQKNQWDALVESIRDRKACNLVRDMDQRDVVRIRLTGQVKAAVGALKVRVENLAAGEKIDRWHPSFAFSNNQFVLSIGEQTGGYLRADHRRKVLKAYGRPEVIEAIRANVEVELGRLASKEWTTILQRQVVGYFIRHGVPSLKEMFGEESAQFNAASRAITVRGEEARHTLKTLVSQAMEASAAPIPWQGKSMTCPVCYDNVSTPLVLGCKHAYCTSCLRHYLTNAEESDKFPIVCIGDESRCGVPIALPVIQRFLTPADFTRLLEVAFTSYITHHPQELKYCKTPDCIQIYRATEGTSQAIQCPSCFSSVCSSCHDDGHEGVTCDVKKLSKDAENLSEEWIRRMKKCPQCSVPIEKDGGCNHMSCRCGAHICWRCMGVFAADEIYRHMDAAHGGAHDEGIIPYLEEPIDYAEQEELLRRAREAN